MAAATSSTLTFPKPQGAIDKVRDEEIGRIEGALEPAERRMLRQIAEEADLIDAGIEQRGWNLPRFWLLVPATEDLIEFLATFEADRADLEPDSEREHDDAEHEDSDGDDEPEDDGGEGCGAVVTEERRARYRASRAADLADKPFRPLIVRCRQGGARHG